MGRKGKKPIGKSVENQSNQSRKNGNTQTFLAPKYDVNQRFDTLKFLEFLLGVF